MMQIKILTVPALDGDAENEALNHFLKQYKVVDMQKQLISFGNSSYWSFCLQYLTGEMLGRNLKYPEKVDYRNLLQEQEFKRFTQLREIRKEIAQAEALPAFAIFTDAELAEMSKLENLSLEGMKTIKGVGERKIEKYGTKFIPA